jgi:hypothetical protein
LAAGVFPPRPGGGGGGGGGRKSTDSGEIGAILMLLTCLSALKPCNGEGT